MSSQPDDIPGFVSSRVEQVTPIAASMIFHLALLMALALATFSTQEQTPIGTIVSDIAGESLIEPILPTEREFHKDSDSSSGITPLATATALTQVVNAPVDATPQSEEAVPLLFNSLGQTANYAETVSPLPQSSRMGVGGSGTGSGSGGQGGGDEQFFGLNLNGTSVVFVVDASSSMNFPHPGPAQTRFGRVKLELIKFIGQMTDRERFFMIFFNEFAIPMPANQLVAATDENKQKYLSWMAPGKASGSTEPEDALLAAVRLRPEVIYFLTDGRFNFSLVQTVTEANHRRVVINTICFGDPQGEKFLQQLAKNNGGIYRFVADEAEAVSTSSESKDGPASQPTLPAKDPIPSN